MRERTIEDRVDRLERRPPKCDCLSREERAALAELVAARRARERIQG